MRHEEKRNGDMRGEENDTRRFDSMEIYQKCERVR